MPDPGVGHWTRCILVTWATEPHAVCCLIVIRPCSHYSSVTCHSLTRCTWISIALTEAWRGSRVNNRRCRVCLIGSRGARHSNTSNWQLSNTWPPQVIRVQSRLGLAWPVSPHNDLPSTHSLSLWAHHRCVTWCCVTASCWMTHTLPRWWRDLGLDTCRVSYWVLRCSLNQHCARYSPGLQDCCSWSARAQCSVTSSGPS